MRAGSRVFWLTILCFFVVGCGGYRTTGLPPMDGPCPTGDDADGDTIKRGDMLRVTLHDGRAFRGSFVSCARETLSILEESEGDEYDSWESPAEVVHLLPVNQVDSVERYDSKNGGLILVGAGIVIMAAVVIGKSIQDSLDWGDGLFSEK